MIRLASLLSLLSLAIVALAVVPALSGCSPHEPLAVAEDVDLARFQGQWFEIAKLPRIAETNCTRTRAFYTYRDGGLDLLNQCHVDKPDGELKSQSMRATIAESNAQLNLALPGGFTGDYWIIEVGEHYEYALIGVPSREYLWVLSRSPKMAKAELDTVLAHATAKKFDVSKLEYTVQTGD